MSGSLFRAAAAVLLSGSLPLCGQLQVLPYRPVAAAYSVALDRMVLAHAQPDQLRLLNPVSGAETIVALPEPPRALAVSRDGRHALVGHVSSVSYIDLTQTSPTVGRSVASPNGVSQVGITNSGVAYYADVSMRVRYFTVPSGAVVELDVYSVNFNARNILVTADDSAIVMGYSIYSLVNGILQPETQRGTSNCLYSYWVGSSALMSVCGEIRDAALSSFPYLGRVGDPVATATASSAREELAVILSDGYYSPSVVDTEVRLYGTEDRAEYGRLPLPRFAAGTNTAAGHGRWLFYNNASTRLFVVQAADATSGLLNDYGIATFSMPSACSVSTGVSALNADPAGGYGAVSASSSCVWQASSASPWLDVVANVRGTGSTAVEYYAAPNMTGQTRTGTLIIGNQSVTVTQLPAPSPGAVATLPYKPIDVEYSAAFGRLVMLTDRPRQLHIYNPSTKLETAVVPLRRVPTSLALSLDGRFALVGYDGAASRIDLVTAAETHFLPVPTRASDVALSSTFAYIVGYDVIVSVNLATQQTTVEPSYGGYSVAKLTTSGEYLLLGGSSSLARWTAANAPAKWLRYGNPQGVCDRMWTSADGLRLITGCGLV